MRISDGKHKQHWRKTNNDEDAQWSERAEQCEQDGANRIRMHGRVGTPTSHASERWNREGVEGENKPRCHFQKPSEGPCDRTIIIKVSTGNWVSTISHHIISGIDFSSRGQQLPHHTLQEHSMGGINNMT